MTDPIELLDGEPEEPESPFFRAWAKWVLGNRILVALLLVAVTGGFMWMIANHLKSNMTIESFLNRDSDALATLEAYRDQFGRDDTFLVIAEGDVFSMPYLERLKGLHDELASIDMEIESLGERVRDRKGTADAHEAARRVAAAEAAKATPEAPMDADFGDFGDGGDDFADFADFGDRVEGGEEGELPADDWADEAGGTIVDEVISLINFRQTRGSDITTAGGDAAVGIEVGELMDPFPTESELEALRARVLADSTLVGQVVGADGRHSAIAVRTQFMAELDSHRVNDRIAEIMQKYDAPGFRTHISGMPSLAASLNRMMLSEIRKLFGLAIGAVFLVMLLLFRHPLGVVGPLTVVVLSNLWSFGTMAVFGLPVTMLSNILPAFVVCVGIGDSIHIQSVYRDARVRGADNREAIIKAIATTGVPVLFTTITTMFGLLSFQFATIDAIGEMGIAAALGVFYALLTTLLVLPVTLSLNKKSVMGARAAEARTHADFIDRFLDWCATASGRSITAAPGTPVNHRHRRLTLAVGVGLVVVAGFGASTLSVYHDPLSWVPDDDPTKTAFTMTDREIGGAATIQLLIESNTEHGMKDLELLQGLEKLEAHIRSYDYPHADADFVLVGNAMSLLDIVRETNRALHGGDDAHYAVPATQEEVNGTLFLFENSGPAQLRRMASADLGVSQMTIRVRWLEATSYGPLTEHVQAGIDQFLAGRASVRTTGAAFTLFTTVSSLIWNLLRSFSMALLVITIFMMVLLRDVKLGLISMVPNLIPVLMIMGFMGFVGIPIDMNNLLIASIAIGLAVDDTIHFLHHYKVHFDRFGDVEDALSHSFRHSGRAMVSTSMILSVGFFVYLGATLANLQRFGMLIGMTIIAALLVDIIFGPALIRTLFRSRDKATTTVPASPGLIPGVEDDGSMGTSALPS